MTPIKIFALGLLLIFSGCSLAKHNVTHVREITSDDFFIDRIFPSMKGPMDRSFFKFSDSENSELIWLQSIRGEILDEKGKRHSSDEYLCHSNLSIDTRDLDIRERNKKYGIKTHTQKKLITLIQGQTDITFPKGFGLPFYSDETFFYGAMVLNTRMDEDPFNIKVRTTIEYAFDKDLDKKPKPLFKRSKTIRVPILSEENSDPQHHSESCEPDEYIPEKAKTASDVRISENSKGELTTAHWMVPPGKHIYRSKLEHGIGLPYDTTVHYITVHLHAYGQSLELINLTTGKSVFKSNATNYEDRMGIENLEHYSSQEGMLIHKDHEYELIAEYDNPTEQDIDAMAVMYLYFLDKKFSPQKQLAGVKQLSEE